ncbi:MAG: hypothetical protein WCV90_02080 [Candidatus Woesearchaeota archaeon]
MTPREKELERELELYHTTLDDGQRDFLKKRGFEIVHGPATYSHWADESDQPRRVDRPYFIISDAVPFTLECHADGGGNIGGYRIDPSAQSAESLVGLMETTALMLKGKSGDFYAPSPEGQGLLVYVDTPEWDPVWDILIGRWGGKR